MKASPSRNSRGAPRSKQRGIFINPWCFKQRVNVRVESVLVTSCDDIITLSATITGNAVNRTFEWVQISGTPVTWLEDRFQTDAMFQQPAMRDDKVFRFYMDRGLSTEIKRDVLVTSVGKEDVANVVPHVSSNLLRAFVSGDEATSLVMVPGFSAYGTYTLNNPDKVLMWKNTESPLLSYSNIVVSATGQPDVVNPVGKSTYYAGVTMTATYTVQSVFASPAFDRTALSIPLTPITNNSFEQFDLSERIDPVPAISSAMLIKFEVLQPELVSLSYDEQVSSTLPAVSSSLTVLNFTHLELYSYEPQVENLASVVPNLSSKNTIISIADLGLTTLG